MKLQVKLDGFKDLEKALAEIGKRTTAKAVARRALKKAAEPVAELASSLAPEGDTKTLRPSVAVGTKLSKRQARLHRKMFRNDKAAVEMFAGAGPLPSAHQQEFGNENHAAQPFMRPAWDAEAMPTLDRLGNLMAAEIAANAKRAAKRAAKAAKKG